MAIFLLTPFTSETAVLRIGLILFVLGFTGLFSALFTYAKAPMDEAITAGLYRYSRNPQWLMLALMTLGNAISIGSWTAVILLAIATIGYHFRLLGEEEVLTEQYGESYRQYLKQVPRYFLFI